MNTKYLMLASALVMAVIGLAFTFAADEILRRGGYPVAPSLLILGQVLGALYCGFALMNWMAKGTVLGGIYGRPIVIGNLVHFTIGGLAMLKLCITHSPSAALWTITGVYALFAGLFGYVMYTHPGRSAEK